MPIFSINNNTGSSVLFTLREWSWTSLGSPGGAYSDNDVMEVYECVIIFLPIGMKGDS